LVFWKMIEINRSRARRGLRCAVHRRKFFQQAHWDVGGLLAPDQLRNPKHLKCVFGPRKK
jgi:hypothetical protein